jgi:Ca-activated chloride channel homolog
MQANQPAIAIPVFKKVLALSPEEPQSYRDLGLAYAADKQAQKAINTLLVHGMDVSRRLG